MSAQIQPTTPEIAAKVAAARALLIEHDPIYRKKFERETRQQMAKIEQEQAQKAAEDALTFRFYKSLITVSDDDDEQFEPPILRLNGQPLLFYQSLLGIIGNIGTGKSHICEILASRYLTGTVLNDGIQCDPAQRDVLYFDIERGRRHLKTRTINRTRHHLHDSALFRRFRMLDGVDWTPEDLRRMLELGIREFPQTGLVVIDPLTSAVHSPNDEKESFELVRWMKAFAKQHNIAVIVAIHGNRNDLSSKAKGHLGDAVQREALAFLRVETDGKDGAIRYLTANFDNGKTREGDKGKASTGFKWHDVKACYDEIAITLGDVNGTIREEMQKCFRFAEASGLIDKQFTQTEFIKLYQECKASTASSRNAITSRIKDAVHYRFLREVEINPKRKIYQFIPDMLMNEN